MAPIANDDNIDEAPSSPRTAALYYWGGGGGHNWEDGDCHKSGVATLRDYTTSVGGGRQLHRQRHRRPLIKFHLEMDDEDDFNHWMFRPAPAQASSRAAVATNFVHTALHEEGSNPKLLQSPNYLTQVSVAATSEKTENDAINDGDFNTIPIISLDQPLEKYAKQIGIACREIGFFYIVNHGIEQCIIDDVMDASKRFFELDLENKIALNSGGNGIEKKGYRGYFGIGAEDLDNKDGTRDLASEEQHGVKKVHAIKGDFKEGFDLGLEQQDMNGKGDSNCNACLAFFGANAWPDEDKHHGIVGFRQTLLRYQNELLKLADRLMVAFAMSAGLPIDYFLSRTRNPMCTLRLLHYPPSSSMSNSGCGAHTDYGLFTILQQDHIGGLQVRNHTKKWINAKPLRGSFVINVGDMLSHWTSGVYASTVHRVESPSSSSGYHRYSVPFFFNPDHDAVVEPILNLKNESGDDGGGDRDRCIRRRSSALEILLARYKGTFRSGN
ncbi:hypothetical protein ACHAXM_005191 [Skeletonema potamos]|jgi:isopenicillin N synthase-like dioxygenase